MFTTLKSFDTIFSADSIEWCPIDNLQHVFVCGTYQLTESENPIEKKNSTKRLGRIYMFQVLENAKLEIIQKIDVAAVLDMKWANTKFHHKILLGVVNSKGYLQIYILNNEKENLCLTLQNEIRVHDGASEVLALSLDWSTEKYMVTNIAGENGLKVVVSDSRGSITLFKVTDECITEISSWLAHEFEAWIVAFDKWDTNIMYTGGDDCKFQRFDIRLGNKPTMINRIHGAGVTSLHCNPTKEHLLTSGSYDEMLRNWDTRRFKQPLTEVNVGGGIWRLKWNPFEGRYLLAACMYGGFRIIDCLNADTPNIIAEYKEHESIAYGCDWSFLSSHDIKNHKIYNEGENLAIVGTCSFYDHLLKLSVVQFADLRST